MPAGMVHSVSPTAIGRYLGSSSSRGFGRIIVLSKYKDQGFLHHFLALKLREVTLSQWRKSLSSPRYLAWQTQCTDCRSPGPRGLRRAPSMLKHSPKGHTSICCCKVVANCNFVISYFFSGPSLSLSLQSCWSLYNGNTETATSCK